MPLQREAFINAATAVVDTVITFDGRPSTNSIQPRLAPSLTGLTRSVIRSWRIPAGAVLRTRELKRHVGIRPPDVARRRNDLGQPPSIDDQGPFGADHHSDDRAVDWRGGGVRSRCGEKRREDSGDRHNAPPCGIFGKARRTGNRLWVRNHLACDE